jgi:hypothetical protein
LSGDGGFRFAHPPYAPWASTAPKPVSQIEISLFAAFSSEKEVLAFA